MKFDTPATGNPIDQLKVVGKPLDRIDGPLKTTGTAPYAYERHDVAANQAYGFVLGAAIAKGRINAIDTAPARRAPGVLAVVTTLDMPPLEKGKMAFTDQWRRKCFTAASLGIRHSQSESELKGEESTPNRC